MGARRSRGFVCCAVFIAGCRIGYDHDPLSFASAGGGGTSGSSAGARAPGGSGGTPSSGGGVASHAGAGAPDAGSAGAPDVPPRCPVSVSPITDYCTSLPRLTDAVILDGKLDCGLMPVDVAPQGWAYDPTRLDATLRFAAAWDDGGIYFFLDVRDPSPVSADAADPVWMGDGVEFYVDTDASYENPPGYDAVGTRQIIIGRTHSDGTGLRGQISAELVTGFPIDWAPDRVTVTSTDEGYVVEAYIPGSVLDVPTWKLSAGNHVGLDAAVNVSVMDPQMIGTQGHRVGQFFYHQSSEPAGEPFRNVAGFCSPVLVE